MHRPASTASSVVDSANQEEPATDDAADDRSEGHGPEHHDWPSAAVFGAGPDQKAERERENASCNHGTDQGATRTHDVATSVVTVETCSGLTARA
jgi:hypothetical protein